MKVHTHENGRDQWVSDPTLMKTKESELEEEEAQLCQQIQSLKKTIKNKSVKTQIRDGYFAVLKVSMEDVYNKLK